jgi:hypothetical protein
MAQKRKKTRTAKPRQQKIKKVKLPENAVLQVELPKEVLPLVAVNDGVVEIAPLKRSHAAKRRWWQIF